jgi:preprotein translocase subunit SecA
MDYLRQGINLRAMGQRDPLTEWQREGFDLFSDMMNALSVDYVRYVMHVEVAVSKPEAEPVAEQTASGPGGAGGTRPASGNGAAGDPKTATRQVPRALQGPTVRAADMTASQGGAPGSPDQARPAAAKRRTTQPLVKDDWDRTPRNAPCPCGSGKKFKQCHG